MSGYFPICLSGLNSSHLLESIHLLSCQSFGNMTRGKMKELSLCVIVISLCTETGAFYPFGDGTDTKLFNTNDLGTELALDIGFPYYGDSSTSIYINIDGTLSLWGEQRSFKYVPIPAMKTSAVIAPLCTDMDTTSGNGAVFYRQSTDPALLTSISNEINIHYGGTFQATWAFVCTWDQVEADSTNTVGIFTFQVVLVTDGQTSYTLFIYGSLSESASPKASIQTGFTAGDGSRYFQMPFSLSELQTLGTISPGRWINKVDDFRIVDDTLCEVGGGCPPNHMSNQGCTGNVLITPALSACSPELIGPNLSPDGYIEFTCRVTLTRDAQADTLGLEPRAQISFFFDDDPAGYPIPPIAAGTTAVNLPEVYLKGNFGKSLSCQVYTFYTSTPGTTSSPIRSTPYWIGVKATREMVTVHTADAGPAELSILATLPIPCLKDKYGADMCDVQVRIRSSKPNVALFLVHDDTMISEQGKYRLKAEDWDGEKKMVISETQKIYVRMYPKVPRPATETVQVTLDIHPDYTDRLPEYTDYIPPWVEMTGTFEVEVIGHTNGFKKCSWIGDPHITSFDGLYYHSMYSEGAYMVSRVNNRKLEVLLKQRKIAPWSTRATTCGVIIREGNAAYELSRCNGALEYITKSEHQLPYTPFSKSGTTSWRVDMPSGAYLGVTDYQSYLNVCLYLPWRDWENTDAMCGNSDGNKTNDLVPRGSTSPYPEEYHPTDFINSWELTAGENLFDTCLTEDTTIHYKLQEDRYCSLHSDDMTGAGCGWEALKNNINGGSAFQLHHPGQSSCPMNYKKTFVPYGMPSLYKTPASRLLVQSQNTTDHCLAVLQASPSYAHCVNILNSAVIDEIIESCAIDLEFSDEDTAPEAISVFQQGCIDEAFANPGNKTTEEILDKTRDLSGKLCPMDCSGQGTCVDGNCSCDPGYMGFDCALPETAVPIIQMMRDPVICELQSSACSKSQVLAADIADEITCSMAIEQVNGQIINYVTGGEQFTIDEAHCPLPSVKELNTSATAWPAYKYYDVKISNNGLDYSNTLTQTHVVYDSRCLDCDQQANCVRKGNSCLIGGECHKQYDRKNDDVCFYCLPASSIDSWSQLQGNQPPTILYQTIYRKNGTARTVGSLAVDAENHRLTHVLTDPASHPDVQLFTNGTLIWSTGPGEVSQTISITVTDECGQSATADIDLQLICPESMCSYHGLCLYDVGVSVCVCNQYYTGEVCEREISAGEWSNWTDTGCSKQCDYGVLTKTRQCHREPCSGETTEVLVCNLFSCQENPAEQNEGVNMTVHQTPIHEFALSADALIEAINGEIDTYCEMHPAECCNSFGVETVDGTHWTTDVLGSNGAVYIAQSYPRQTAGNEDTKAKIIVGIDSSTFSQLCDGIQNLHRMVRQAEIYYMDGMVLYSALKAGQLQLEQHLDVSLSIENPNPSHNNDVLIGSSIGAAICATAFIVIMVVLHKKGIICKSPEKPSVSENSVAPVTVMTANSTVNNEACDDGGISISVDDVADKH